jgi:formyltetrahydrofolate synthetase
MYSNSHTDLGNNLPVQVVVAINQFKTDTEAEMQAVRQASLDAGAFDAVVSNHWAEGGKGAEKLAEAVAKACQQTNSEDFKYLYDLNLPIREKVEIISKEIYGADGVDFSDVAEQQMVSQRTTHV